MGLQMKHLLMAITGLLMFAGTMAQDGTDYDLVVYGDRSAAITPEVPAERDGLSVIIMCPDRHLGGLAPAGSVGPTPAKSPSSAAWALASTIRLVRHSNGSDETQWTIEPYVAERVFEGMVREHEIPIHRRRHRDRSMRPDAVGRLQRFE